MNEKLIHLSCERFTEQLSSKTPVPGGGGAAALSAALGCALCSMAANLTLGKKKYVLYENDLQRIIESCAMLRSRFLSLVDKDAAAFEPLSRAYMLPADSPERDRVLMEASLMACAAPCEILECCCVAVQLLEELSDKCSPLVLSDVGCGAASIRAALESAAMNVYINTRSLAGNTEAEAIEKKAGSIISEFIPRVQALADSISARIRRNDG